MSEQLGEPISTETIRRTIKESGTQYLVVKEEEILNPEQKARRLTFAKAYLKHDFKYCLFTDEKTFELGGGAHKKWQDPHNRKREE